MLRGWETPGVAEDTAEGIVISSETGCLGVGGGGGAETEAFPSL